MSNISVEVEMRRVEIGTFVIDMTKQQYKEFRADRNTALQLYADQEVDWEPYTELDEITSWRVL